MARTRVVRIIVLFAAVLLAALQLSTTASAQDRRTDAAVELDGGDGSTRPTKLPPITKPAPAATDVELHIGLRVRDIGVPDWAEIWLPGREVSIQIPGTGLVTAETVGDDMEAWATFSVPTGQGVAQIQPIEVPGFETFDAGMNVPNGYWYNQDFNLTPDGENMSNWGYMTDGIWACTDLGTGDEFELGDAFISPLFFFNPDNAVGPVQCVFDLQPTRIGVLNDPGVILYPWLVTYGEGANGPSSGDWSYDVEAWTDLDITFATAKSVATTTDLLALPTTGWTADGAFLAGPYNHLPTAGTDKIRFDLGGLPSWMPINVACRSSVDAAAWPNHLVDVFQNPVTDDRSIVIKRETFEYNSDTVDFALDAPLYCYLQGVLIAP